MTAIAIEFDFETRIEANIAFEQVRTSCESGKRCWIDLDLADPARVEKVLRELDVNQIVIDETLANRVGGRYDGYQNCLHASVSAPSLENGLVTFKQVEFILGERYLITVHRGPIDFVEQVKKSYSHFFRTFAKSLGFLLFELWDKHIEGYRKALRQVEDEVEALQASILGDVDDTIFNEVASAMHNLLVLRKNVLADREVLHHLAVHRSAFVPESTQPFLTNLVGTLERLGSDLTVEREILAETLNLYLGIVSHRTNRVVNRLTIISIIFLPLTFLCGVYGMNFEILPEFKWEYGYLYFWVLAISIAGSLLFWMRRMGWLDV